MMPSWSRSTTSHAYLEMIRLGRQRVTLTKFNKYGGLAIDRPWQPAKEFTPAVAKLPENVVVPCLPAAGRLGPHS
jgi:hypothetical protein